MTTRDSYNTSRYKDILVTNLYIKDMSHSLDVKITFTVSHHKGNIKHIDYEAITDIYSNKGLLIEDFTKSSYLKIEDRILYLVESGYEKDNCKNNI